VAHLPKGSKKCKYQGRKQCNLTRERKRIGDCLEKRLGSAETKNWLEIKGPKEKTDHWETYKHNYLIAYAWWIFASISFTEWVTLYIYIYKT
jgi:hypothetical protein